MSSQATPYVAGPPTPADRPPTIVAAFARAVQARGDAPFLLDEAGQTVHSWSGAHERTARLAGALHGLGVRHGDTVGLLLHNRPEFHVLDLAAVRLGAVPVSLYQTLPPEQIAYVIQDAGLRLVMTEQALLPGLLRAAEGLADPPRIVVVDGEAPAGGMTLDALEASAPEGFDVAPHEDAVTEDDLITLIYTSGTTGPPKGVELTHRAIVAAMSGIVQELGLEPGGRVISWLPTAHIAERGANLYIPLLQQLEIAALPDPKRIAQALPVLRPTYFFAVPRVWEKFVAGIEAKLGALPDEARGMAQAAMGAAVRAVRLRQAGDPVPDELAAAVAQAEERLFAPMRAALGLDRAQALGVGAAPVPLETLETLHAIGLEVGEIWGMTEACACGAMNRPGRAKLGTVGPPLPGVELRLAEDGEVELRGSMLMERYRNRPDATAEVLRDDGWYATGDVGTFDDDGFLRIVDRKKELIINAAGKNMSPANIEATLKAAHGLIGQVCVFGDRRPYNVALVVLDPDVAPVWAAAHGIAATDPAALAEEPAVREAVAAAIEEANARLSRVEQVKRFELLRHDWLPGGDELTPTMKLKRKPIAAKYAATVDALYAG
ncbi:long-chain fatty acid--CoA ligase [Patulibacter sp. SYSU D01012]|uniref:AMP-dependent synthetase/ligase n=1 Tax=Patulibacter sp. SYSU D01012 TaxID=2817381 RepID=UPI0032C1C830